MKQVKGNIIRGLICVVCVCALGAYCASQKWLLMFRGQQEMFLFDWGYIKDILLHPGGLAEVIAKFLVQFFTVPGVGAVVTFTLLGLNAWMVWKLMERTAITDSAVTETAVVTEPVEVTTGIHPIIGHFDKLSDQSRVGHFGKLSDRGRVGHFGGLSDRGRVGHFDRLSDRGGLSDQDERKVWGIFPFCLLPSVFLAVSLLDYYCFYQGLIAYIAAVFCLLEYSKIKNNHLLWGCAMTVGLFFLAGSVALLFAVRALLFDIFVKRPKGLLSVIYPVITLVLGFAMIQAGEIATILEAFTPAMYYEVDIPQMPEIHYVSWVMLSVCIFIGALSRRITVKGNAAKTGVCILSLVITLFTFIWSCDRFKSDAKMRIYRLECLATNGDWDEIIRLHGKDVRSQNEANYRNLALAEKGLLAEDLFKYRQNGPLSLINDVKSQNDIDLLRLGRVLFAMGNMGAAQSAAFNADQAFGGHVPSMLGMVLDIDLMRGSYATAGKYIRLMEKSLLHSKWASSRRIFLGNDEAVMNDEVLCNGRRDLQCEDAFVLYTNPMDDLFRIVDANPSDEKAMEYALSYLLLAKDMDNVVGFIDKRYGAPALRSLPTPAQDCMLFYADYFGTMDIDFAVSHGMSREEVGRRQAYDLDWCLAHGVTEENVARFRSFKEKYGAAMRSQNPQASMAAFRDTFWYYLLFTQITDN